MCDAAGTILIGPSCTPRHLATRQDLSTEPQYALARCYADRSNPPSSEEIKLNK